MLKSFLTLASIFDILSFMIRYFKTVLSSVLSSVPTIVTAHKFCASQDIRGSCGWYLPIQGYFCAV